MARTVPVIHGAGEPRRRRGRVYWEPLLGDSLGRGYRVRAPRMPRPEHPQYWTWARRIDELIRSSRRPTLVGHSFGASVLLKYLAETVRRPPFAGLFWSPHHSGGRTFRNLRYPQILGSAFVTYRRSVCTTAGTMPRSPSGIWRATGVPSLTPPWGFSTDAATSSIRPSSRKLRPIFAGSLNAPWNVSRCGRAREPAAEAHVVRPLQGDRTMRCYVRR
jgi:hypothetical protein